MSSLPVSYEDIVDLDGAPDHSCTEELDALACIYPDTLHRLTPTSVLYQVPVDPPDRLHLRLPSGASAGAVFTLPPLELTIVLPKTYPSSARPRVRVVADYLRLDVLAALADAVDEAAAKEGPIVFECIAAAEAFVEERLFAVEEPGQRDLWLPDGAAEGKGTGAGGDARVARCAPCAAQTARALVEAAERAEAARLAEGYFKCPACWERKHGREAVVGLAACRHVACLECAGAFWESRIAEGRVGVGDVVCLVDGCGAAAGVGEVRRAVSQVLYERYERLLLKRALEAEGLVECGRKGCERVAEVDASVGKGLGRCAYCSYAFCAGCRRAWHEGGCRGEEEEGAEVLGLVARCAAGDEEAMQELRGREGTSERVQLCVALCGMGGRVCPACGEYVTRNGGCAHMKCRCGSDFCWRCGGELEGGLQHYAPGGACRLYDGAEQQAVHEEIWAWLFGAEVA